MNTPTITILNVPTNKSMDCYIAKFHQGQIGHGMHGDDPEQALEKLNDHLATLGLTREMLAAIEALELDTPDWAEKVKKERIAYLTARLVRERTATQLAEQKRQMEALSADYGLLSSKFCQDKAVEINEAVRGLQSNYKSVHDLAGVR